MNIQWFPGHMAKTRKLLKENLKLVDVVIELLDARIPESSKNHDIDDIIKNKPRIIALNKADLADEKISQEWLLWFRKKGINSIFIDSIKGTGINRLKAMLKSLSKDRIEKDMRKGRLMRPTKAMVIGIPNVGKSSLINKIVGRARAATADKPGVTRDKQWIRLNPEVELLDTPGVLWPKFEDLDVALNLAFTGAIKDEAIDLVEIAAALMERLKLLYPDNIRERFKLNLHDNQTGLEMLKEAGVKRGCLVSGGEVDLSRISAIVLDEFRGGKVGRITLERPDTQGVYKI